ncbi:NACHT, LRR and PYD domains-containing protein 3 [Lycodopsis pacificus]
MMDDSELEAMATPSDSSLGDAVSGRGQSVSGEGDDLFYIPERRPSLDLGPSPMDTSHWQYVDQASSPALGYSSMTSEGDSIHMSDEDGSPTRVQLNGADSYSSCYSLDSDDCEKMIPKLKCKDDTVSELPIKPEFFQDPNEPRHPSLTVAFTFKAISNTLGKLSESDIRYFKMLLWKRYSHSFNTHPQALDMVDLVDRLLECFNLEFSLQITKTLLQDIGQTKIIDYLETLCIKNEVHYDLCENLKKKFGEVREDADPQAAMRPFDDVFTDLYISSTCDNGPNIDHEVVTVEKLDSSRKKEKLLSTKDIFSAERMKRKHFKFMLITGVAGSGKSMAVRRLVLDWIEKKSHLHVSFLFPLSFRELKQFENSRISVVEILQTLYPATKKLRDEDYNCDDGKIMFIFDGLDEYKGELDFHNTSILRDLKDPTTLNIIVVNLLRERLLFRSLLLVFSRSQVRRCLPYDTHYDEIDVRGFHDPQKDEYFQKRFTDPDQAARVIAYINSSKTLRIMCHLPLFCSLVADEFQPIFRNQATWAEPPRNLTHMYTKLLLALIRPHRAFRAPTRSLNKERDFLMKVGKLAFDMLERGKFKISKYDWEETGVNDVEVVINSGLCIQYMKSPLVLCHEKVISFIHPTMQEYLAALYVFLYFTNQGKNIFEQQLKDRFKGIFKGHTVIELYKSAVDTSLRHDDGKYDIFLRFLLGMGLKTNLGLLEQFCTSTVKWPTLIEDATALIEKRIRENQYPGRNGNLTLCLQELKS